MVSAAAGISIIQPEDGTTLQVDDAHLAIGLPAGTSLQELTIELNGMDVTSHFTVKDRKASASMWEMKLDDVTPEGNTLQARNKSTRESVSVGFSVETDKAWVVRDKWGIPHIYAFTKEAGHFASGWLVCEDQGTPAPGSSHFFDQSKLYQQKKLKKTLFNFRDVMANKESGEILTVR